MKQFPHRYTVRALLDLEGDVRLESENLPALASAPPLEFDGPGDRWSPETFLVAAVADCFTLTFKALAGAAKFSWQSLDCEVEGKLDRVGRTMQFTEFTIHATLQLAEPGGKDTADQLLQKAKERCLISNSLKADFHLEARVFNGF